MVVNINQARFVGRCRHLPDRYLNGRKRAYTERRDCAQKLPSGMSGCAGAAVMLFASQEETPVIAESHAIFRLDGTVLGALVFRRVAVWPSTPKKRRAQVLFLCLQEYPPEYLQPMCE